MRQMSSLYDPDTDVAVHAAGVGQRVATVHETLKCVWSGHGAEDIEGCTTRIPAAVVAKAWRGEMELGGMVEGFFHFSWRNGVWLAYGVQDGSVRGVYCPTHCSERAARRGAPQQRKPAESALA
jgi:hypothetical protein